MTPRAASISSTIRRLSGNREIEPNGMGNHLRRKPVTTIERITCRSGHAARSHILIDARLTLQCLVGSFAEFERAMIQERVRAGLARARSEGKRLGRPPIAAALEKRIREALATPGRPGIRVIAERFGVNPSTVQRISRPFDGASVAVA